jgi:hypothetical protein
MGDFADRLLDMKREAVSKPESLTGLANELAMIRFAAVDIASDERQHHLAQRLDKIKERLDSIMVAAWIVVALLAYLALR